MNISEWCAKHPQAWADLWSIIGPASTSSEGGSEARVQSALRLTAANLSYSLWRNNSGACTDETGRLVRYGLGNDSARFNKVWKSSDLIGIGPGGRFVAVEVKAPGWKGPSNERERAQANFLANVQALGGIGIFATSVNDYMKAVAS